MGTSEYSCIGEWSSKEASGTNSGCVEGWEVVGAVCVYGVKGLCAGGGSCWVCSGEMGGAGGALLWLLIVTMTTSEVKQ